MKPSSSFAKLLNRLATGLKDGTVTYPPEWQRQPDQKPSGSEINWLPLRKSESATRTFGIRTIGSVAALTCMALFCSHFVSIAKTSESRAKTAEDRLASIVASEQYEKPLSFESGWMSDPTRASAFIGDGAFELWLKVRSLNADVAISRMITVIAQKRSELVSTPDSEEITTALESTNNALGKELTALRRGKDVEETRAAVEEHLMRLKDKLIKSGIEVNVDAVSSRDAIGQMKLPK